VKLHFVFTHLSQPLVLFIFTLNFGSMMIKLIFSRELFILLFMLVKLVNSKYVVLARDNKFGHEIRQKVPMVQQKCPPIGFYNFAIFRVRKKQGRFKSFLFSF